MLPRSRIEEVTQNRFVFKLADRHTERLNLPLSLWFLLAWYEEVARWAGSCFTNWRKKLFTKCATAHHRVGRHELVHLHGRRGLFSPSGQRLKANSSVVAPSRQDCSSDGDPFCKTSSWSSRPGQHIRTYAHQPRQNGMTHSCQMVIRLLLPSTVCWGMVINPLGFRLTPSIPIVGWMTINLIPCFDHRTYSNTSSLVSGLMNPDYLGAPSIVF